MLPDTAASKVTAAHLSRQSLYPCGGRHAGVKIGAGCPPMPALA
jgi:hypothetical protein